MLDAPIELKGTIYPSGYKCVAIRNGKVKRSCRVNRVVWIAANGIIPPGYVVDHINNDKLDNRLVNLQLLTPEENSHKAWEDGLYLYGTDNPQTKVSPEAVKQICDEYKHGDITMRKLAEKYGISKSRVHQLIKNNGWTNIVGAKDTPRYKAIGNGIAKPCSDFVLGGIARVMKEVGEIG